MSRVRLRPPGPRKQLPMTLFPLLPRPVLLAAALALSISVRAEPLDVPDLRAAHDPQLQGRSSASCETRSRGGGRTGGLRWRWSTQAGAPPRLAMLNGDQMMYAASLPKIAILLGAMVEAERGRLPLDEERLSAMTNMIRLSSNRTRRGC